MISCDENYGLVSIIMPTFNGSQHILKSIESVIEQSYRNWELLVIDDCSTDNTRDIVRSVDDSRVKLLCNEMNSGAAISRNYGLREATGRWIAFLDSDDLWLPDKLAMQLAFMKDESCAFSFTDYAVVEPNGMISPYSYIGPMVVDKKIMRRYCYFSTITVLYDSEVVGLLQIADVKKNNDYALWLKAVEKTKCYRFPRCLSVYCRRAGSISSGNKLKLIKHHYILFRIAEEESAVQSLIDTARNMFFGLLKKATMKQSLPDDVRVYLEKKELK